MKNKNMIRNVLFITILITAIFILAGCTGTGASAAQVSETKEAGAGETGEAVAAGNEVIIEGNAFKPDNLTIKAGDTVTWINNDSYNHTVKDNDATFESGKIGSGQKYSFTFDKEGTYDYICGVHTFMKGTITVTK